MKHKSPSPKSTRLLGERNGKAKLTEDMVERIRRLGGVMTQQEIAKVFKVHQSQISRILGGLHWRHLTAPLIKQATDSEGLRE